LVTLPWERPLGALPDGDATLFRVWAPHAEAVAVRAEGGAHPLEAEGHGVFAGRAPLRPGDLYRLELAGGEGARATWPDPVSRSQPEGVRGPSQVVDPAAFAWSDAGWRGLRLEELVLYELHVGTFSPEGTFAGVVPALRRLRELGVTAIELMPVATGPGARGWGYDGLYAYAPHPAYGGPEGLAALVDAAHAEGIGVVLDVVYNHAGPGSEALEAFGPFFTDRYGTPWGRAINYDGPDSGGVREWALQNAEMWVRDFHVDGLRVDAVHAVYDAGARPVLAELCARVKAAAPRALVIAESDRNDPRTITPSREGGLGFDAQWADEFHHALRAALTGERDGYYEDFGRLGQVGKAMGRPFVFDGDFSPHRRRRHGAPAGHLPPERFVVFAQNHDQVGNRALGDRLAPELLPLAAFCTLLSPFTPMLFMGEEHGERRPFAYFTDHIDPGIAEATREGRRREFAHFVAFADEVPDPQDPETFMRSKLDPAGGDAAVADLYRRLLALRPQLPRETDAAEADEQAGLLRLRRGRYELVANFGAERARVPSAGRELVLATHPAALADGVLELPGKAGAVTAADGGGRA
jgi:maltooligosyltrehalose trehalohydrolase